MPILQDHLNPMQTIQQHAAVTAGDQSELETAQRETHEELGIDVPMEVGEQACLHNETFHLYCHIVFVCNTPLGHCHNSNAIVTCIASFLLAH